MILTTSIYAALLTFIFIGLSFHVVRGRRQHSVALGDGGVDEMKARIRAQANFAEYSPLFLLLLALVEYQGLPVYIVHLIGATFVLGRLSHAYGVLLAEPQRNLFKPRIIGMIATFVSLAILAVILLLEPFLR